MMGSGGVIDAAREKTQKIWCNDAPQKPDAAFVVYTFIKISCFEVVTNNLNFL